MNNVELTILVTKFGSLMFGVMFLWYALESASFGMSGKQKESLRALDMMGRSGLAFFVFVLIYLLTHVFTAVI